MSSAPRPAELFDPVFEPRPGNGSALRVALFSGNYNCVRDGANQALNRLVDHLIGEAGAQVRVYSPTAAVPAFAAAGDLVSVRSVPIPGRSEYRLALGLPATVREDITRFKPNVFHLSAPDLLGTRAQGFARQLGVPVVTSLHTRFETYLEHYGFRFLRRTVERKLQRFYAASDYVLAPTPPMVEDMRSQGLGDKVRLWGRGVDRAIFNPARRSREWRLAHGYGDDDVVVLFFGRLVKEKGIDSFVRVVEQARGSGRRIRPLIIGDGPARSWFAERLPNASFTGHLSGNELGCAVASADVLINPSITEAFGNVTLEAMAAGLAIICADMPSASALLENGVSGLLVPPLDIRGYVGALEMLLDSAAARAALASAAAAQAVNYSWRQVLSGVVDVYRGAVAQFGGR